MSIEKTSKPVSIEPCSTAVMPAAALFKSEGKAISSVRALADKKSESCFGNGVNFVALRVKAVFTSVVLAGTALFNFALKLAQAIVKPVALMFTGQFSEAFSTMGKSFVAAFTALQRVALWIAMVAVSIVAPGAAFRRLEAAVVAAGGKVDAPATTQAQTTAHLERLGELKSRAEAIKTEMEGLRDELKDAKKAEKSARKSFREVAKDKKRKEERPKCQEAVVAAAEARKDVEQKMKLLREERVLIAGEAVKLFTENAEPLAKREVVGKNLEELEAMVKAELDRAKQDKTQLNRDRQSKDAHKKAKKDLEALNKKIEKAEAKFERKKNPDLATVEAHKESMRKLSEEKRALEAEIADHVVAMERKDVKLALVDAGREVLRALRSKDKEKEDQESDVSSDSSSSKSSSSDSSSTTTSSVDSKETVRGARERLRELADKAEDKVIKAKRELAKLHRTFEEERNAATRNDRNERAISKAERRVKEQEAKIETLETKAAKAVREARAADQRVEEKDRKRSSQKPPLTSYPVRRSDEEPAAATGGFSLTGGR